MKIYLLLTLCVAFWAGNFVVGRFVRFDLDPIELSFFRWLLVCILLLPQIFKHRKNIIHTLKHHFIYILAVSFLGVSAFNTLVYLGLQKTMATNALMINSSIPILIITLSAIFLKTKISKVQFLGVVISMFGVIYLALNGNLTNIITLDFNSGDLLIFTSSLTWAIYSILLKAKPKSIEALLPASVLIGMILFAPLYFLTGHHISHIFSVSQSGLLSILYTALFASLVSYILWAKGIESIGANKTGQFTHLMAPLGIFFAYIFLGEKLHIYHIYGFVLIGFGLWLSLVYTNRDKITK